jgi:hypothetical protein
MTNERKIYKKLFMTGFFQVFFVAISTYMIAHKIFIGAFLSAFLISWLWTFNVRKIAVATFYERFVYSIGAACGSVSGLMVSIWVL